MATTTQVTVTKSWVKLASGDCTVQSIKSSGLFDIAVGADEPSSSAYITISLATPTTFAYKTAVWCKLSSSSGDSTTINVIK